MENKIFMRIWRDGSKWGIIMSYRDVYRLIFVKHV